MEKECNQRLRNHLRNNRAREASYRQRVKRSRLACSPSAAGVPSAGPKFRALRQGSLIWPFERDPSTISFFFGKGMFRFLTIGLIWVLAMGCRPETHQLADARSADVDRATAAAATDSLLELHFLDVNQGDATLIRNGGRVALVDAGPSDRIVRRLRQLGVDTIDLLVASHNHADHIGGMDAVLDSFVVRFYLDNGHPATTRIQERVLERVERKGITYLRATPRTVSLGDARLRIIPAPDDVGGDDQNNRSVTVVVERGDFRALLSGDSEEALLNAHLEAGRVADVDVLKAAHHGSRNGVVAEWLAAARPEWVIISVGQGNNYGHPHPEALHAYCKAAHVLRTDRLGDVTITVSPTGSYTVEGNDNGEC